MTIFEEADKLINNDRRGEYGSVRDSFSNIAMMWSAILDIKVTSRQVALCMIALKIQRAKHKFKRDNQVDICGYAGLLQQLEGNEPIPTEIKAAIETAKEVVNKPYVPCANCSCEKCTSYYEAVKKDFPDIKLLPANLIKCDCNLCVEQKAQSKY